MRVPLGVVACGWARVDGVRRGTRLSRRERLGHLTPAPADGSPADHAGDIRSPGGDGEPVASVATPVPPAAPAVTASRWHPQPRR
ncbi:hypothetical protein GCM10010234_21570 [Streptomyces hawaiiensis]|uniref:hypothetical protein n=1 Tax=Streptomyces hawaiiensis TaxID=67305 RepID=UPI0031E1F029